MASRSCVGRAKQSLETRLVDAVRSGDVNAVKDILNKGANVNTVVSSGETPLGVAAHAGDVSVLRLLLDYDGSNRNEEARRCHSGAALDNDEARRCHSDNERTLSNSVIKTGGRNNNCGYFVVYHDELGDQDDSLDDEGRTPEGMEQLEWDVEVEGDDCEVGGGEEEVWACQYRWYADILDKTRCIHALNEEEGLDVRLSRRRKCEVNLQDVHGCAPVHYAASQGHLEALQLLIDAGCQVDVCDAASQTALHLAAANGHTAAVELLLACGGHKAQVNLSTGDSRRMAPLHFAAVRGHTATCQALLAHGAHVNALDSQDRTPLYLAVARQHLHTVRLLLRHGANVNIEEIHGYTAMCEAVWSKNVAIVSALVCGAGGGGIVRLCPAHQLLKYAVLHRHAAMVALLLPLPPHAANVNACDEAGDTPLMLAARTNQLHVASLLLKHGAKANAVNAVSGCTPLLAAVESLNSGVGHYTATIVEPLPLATNSSTTGCSSFEAMVRLLVAYGADLNHCGGPHQDYTPLTKLIIFNKFSMAAFLIRIGADVNKCTKMGDYVFDNLVLARNFKQFTLVQMIVFAGYKLSRQKLDQLVVATPKRATIDAWLLQTVTNVWRLTDLCRLAIRKQYGLGHTTPHTDHHWPLDALLIPNLLKRFIYMEEFQVDDNDKQQPATATSSSSLFI